MALCSFIGIQNHPDDGSGTHLLNVGLLRGYRCYKLKGSYLHNRRRENLKCHTAISFSLRWITSEGRTQLNIGRSVSGMA
jgi:hypothetical protein